MSSQQLDSGVSVSHKSSERATTREDRITAGTTAGQKTLWKKGSGLWGGLALVGLGCLGEGCGVRVGSKCALSIQLRASTLPLREY